MNKTIHQTPIACLGVDLAKNVFHACGMTRAHANPDCCRLMTIPGIGVLSASELLVKLGDGSEFRNGREASASIGLVPRQHSTGGKPKLGGISKQATALCSPDSAHTALRFSRWACEVHHRTWPRWPWPTRTFVSPGRCSGEAETIRKSMV